VFRIAIEPSGKVAEVVIQSSTLHDEMLEQDLLKLLSTTNFGAMTVGPLVINWPISFHPE